MKSNCYKIIYLICHYMRYGIRCPVVVRRSTKAITIANDDELIFKLHLLIMFTSIITSQRVKLNSRILRIQIFAGK